MNFKTSTDALEVRINNAFAIAVNDIKNRAESGYSEIVLSIERDIADKVTRRIEKETNARIPECGFSSHSGDSHAHVRMYWK